MELLSSFGINGKLLLAQVVNFFILLLVLYFFVYKPIISILDKRNKTIKESQDEAERIKQESAELEIKKKEILAKAREEAMKIIQEARKEGENAKGDAVKKAQEGAQKIVSDAKVTIKAEQEAAFMELKKEVADMVIAVSSKVIAKNIDSDSESKLIDNVVKEMENK
ncbi:MAG: F0F1 ATP synthase subunit B [Candidatus Berkelbacteria bacterium]|nr:F0F1 ATP synthase subunit B [Candidatus Berkelbacteria bacterium]